MPNELEIAAAASIGGLGATGVHGAPPPGSACANCGAGLRGPWCHACGQSSEDFHRSIIKLAAEVVEGLFHLDGRLWRTLPDLMVNPGRLTRLYLDGHRAPQIPPLRLFLVTLLALFVVGGLAAGLSKGPKNAPVVIIPAKALQNPSNAVEMFDQQSNHELTAADRADLERTLSQGKVYIGSKTPNLAATAWLKSRVESAIADPERFFLILEQWGERFAFLMLPTSALLLSGLFIFQRQFYLFDHVIFSLHSLSAFGLIIIVAILFSLVSNSVSDIILLYAPFHLYFHLRRVYSVSRLGALIRMGLLFIGSVLAGSILALALIAVGLNGMGDGQDRPGHHSILN